MRAAPKFGIDVAIDYPLTNANQKPLDPAEARGLTLLVPVYPQHPERRDNPDTDTPQERRKWGVRDIYRISRGWMCPFVRSRAGLAGSVCVPVYAQTMGSERIFAELIERNQSRAGGLLEYTADREKFGSTNRISPWRGLKATQREFVVLD
jgi:hypothetical protein